ncbi:MAG: hypothetical protein BGO29_05570 [Bacteroidales bacterium 36-12]|nr:MAG: hypothetical protein BGO29_05570 [Bacteroidales bacterium 36-12]
MKAKQTIITICLLLFGVIVLQAQELTRFYRGDKYGYKNAAGKVVIKPQYTRAWQFSGNFATVEHKKSGKKIIIDKTGKEVLSYTDVDMILYQNATIAIVKLYKDAKFYVISLVDSNKTIGEYENIDNWSSYRDIRFNKGWTKVMRDKDYALMDTLGHITKWYNKIESFNQYNIAYVELYDKYGAVNTRGEEIIPTISERPLEFKKGITIVVSNHKHALVDTLGNIRTRWYDWIDLLDDGSADVALDEKWGVLDTNLVEVVPPLLEGEFSGLGVRMALLGRSYIDITGKTTFDLPPQYEKGSNFYPNGVAIVLQNGKMGLIDTIGQEILAPKYDIIYAFQEELAVMQLNNKKGIIDMAGKEIVEPNYDELAIQRDGILVKQDGKVGLIDKTGKEIVAPKYDEVAIQRDGILVKQDGKVGLIDMTGKEIVAPKYDGITIEKDKILVKQNGKIGLIDKTGKEIVAPKYDGVEGEFYGGAMRVTLNNRTGFVDKTGREIIPPRYEAANRFDNGKASVSLNGRTFCIDLNGKEVDCPRIYTGPRTKINYQSVEYFNASSRGSKAGTYNLQKGVKMKFEFTTSSISEYIEGDIRAWSLIESRQIIHSAYTTRQGAQGVMFVTSDNYYYFLYTGADEGRYLHVTNANGGTYAYGNVYDNDDD